MSLTESQKSIIRASVPVLEASGVELTAGFYQYMFSKYPSVQPFFRQSDQKTMRQPKVLAFALLQYAKNIDDLTPLLGFVDNICEKHVGLQIYPEHYPIVGECLLHQLKKALGDAATDEFMAAWKDAYTALADILIKIEGEKYDRNLSLKNSWKGFRDFVVDDVKTEAIDVKSVYLKPIDGAKVVVPSSGQYICIRFPESPSLMETQREYSVSSISNGDGYRISVRNVPGGSASGFIHGVLKAGDKLKVAAPNGTLVYQPRAKAHVVYAGGIGITPMISIIEQALSAGQSVKLFYSNTSDDRKAFGPWIEDLKKSYPSFQCFDFISQPNSISGRLTGETIERLEEDAVAYVCGPPAYMKVVTTALELLGADPKSVHQETFGPTDV